MELTQWTHSNEEVPGETGWADLVFDGTTKSQYYDQLRSVSAKWTSERKLMLAILADAINDYRGNGRQNNANSMTRRRLRLDAEAWFQGVPNPEPSITFEYCCDLLDIDKDWILKKLDLYPKLSQCVRVR